LRFVFKRLIHPTDLISLCIFIARTDILSFRIICVVSVCNKNSDEKSAFDIKEIFSLLLMCRRTQRLGSIIQDMKLFRKIILSCSFFFAAFFGGLLKKLFFCGKQNKDTTK
jgi:hypothetical protein